MDNLYPANLSFNERRFMKYHKLRGPEPSEHQPASKSVRCVGPVGVSLPLGVGPGRCVRLFDVFVPLDSSDKTTWARLSQQQQVTDQLKGVIERAS